MLETARRYRKSTTAGAAVLAAVLVVGLLAARGRSAPALPRVSAKSLLASAIRAVSRNGPVSGTATVHLDLGLPQIPSTGEGPGTGPLATLSELSGDHTLRVWRSRAGVRIAEILPAAERAVFATRRSLWLWDSTDLTATHVLPRSTNAMAEPGAQPAGRLDPEAMAAKALRAITPSTKVTVGAPIRVARRAAYPLFLHPRTSKTLVGTVEIDLDGSTRLPLRVAITPRGGSHPAISDGFDSVSFVSIDPSMFSFTPPPGSKVKTKQAPSLGTERAAPGARSGYPAPPAVRTFGRGWATIVAVRMPSLSEIAAKHQTLKELVRLLPYSGPLLSVRLVDGVDHSWVVAGLVPQSALAAVASRLP